jgi:hypothetical protein
LEKKRARFEPFAPFKIPMASAWERQMAFKRSTTLGVLGPACGLSAFILALQLQLPVSAMPAARGIDPASVVRTLKSDRLDARPAAARALQLSEQPPLPEGCVDRLDWRQKTAWENEIPGRCVG